MLFNSLDFAVFLPVVFLLFWFVTANRLPLQNLLLLVASYFFYACWDYRFLALLALSTVLDYSFAHKIHQADSTNKKKMWLWISVGINLAILGVFKYFNFFMGSFTHALEFAGISTNAFTLSVILPLGISFYTFHGLSYVIDVYHNRVAPVRNLITYGLFVSFFPLLVAGPIERATHLLPQLQRARTFDYSNAVKGLRQILWGLFKKIVIADTCATFADGIFGNYQLYEGTTLMLGAIFFAIQIYCDFSGYSDIAIGTARLFGIELLRNFSFPYFSRDIAEFWRRWHISLTSWFRDYVYIPLGGSRGNQYQTVRNIFIVFLLSAFWHGADWTFLSWGLLHTLYFLPLVLTKTNRDHLQVAAAGKILPSLKELVRIVFTFILVTFAWIFFRSVTVTDAFGYVRRMFVNVWSVPEVRPWQVMLLVLMFFIVEWTGRHNTFAIELTGRTWQRPARWAFYYLLAAFILMYAQQQQVFIYFQF